MDSSTAPCRKMRSGTRLDSSKPGTGLGLAIACDLLQAYGATIALEDSATLGGLTGSMWADFYQFGVAMTGAVFAAGSNEPLRWTQARRSGSGHRRHRC